MYISLIVISQFDSNQFYLSHPVAVEHIYCKIKYSIN